MTRVDPKMTPIYCECCKRDTLLEESLAQDEPISCLKIAAQLGYTNEGYLRKQFPDLCRAIAKKIAAKRSDRISIVERTLRDALKEKPAPTLEEIRKRLNYSSSMCLQFHFPVLCSQILRRREAHQKTRIAQLSRHLNACRQKSLHCRCAWSAHALESHPIISRRSALNIALRWLHAIFAGGMRLQYCVELSSWRRSRK
jgi:hypothetical protein